MRPNLMSARRTPAGGEDSILAMLEREPARKHARGGSGAHLAWYGLSAAVALSLTGTLVWMAANNDGRRPGESALAQADARNAPRHDTAAAAAAGDGTAGAATVVQVAMAPAPEAQPAGAARIVEQGSSGAAPPLRLLRSAPERPAADKPGPAARAASTAPAGAPAAPVRPAARTAPPPRPAAMPARPRPVMVAKDAARPVQPKARRAASPAESAAAPVDADVAIISAVITHANGHAPEGSQMTELLCPNDGCQARPPRR